MRKDELLMLVTKTIDEKRTFLVNRFLQTEPYSLMSDEEDISPDAFQNYLKVYFSFLDFNQFQKDFSKGKTDEELFSFFLKLPAVVKSIDEKPMIVRISNEKLILDRIPQLSVVAKRLDEKARVKSNLDRQPKDIKHNISSFLDIKDRETLSITSKAFYSNINVWTRHWKDKLLTAGCNKELLEKVLSTHVIKNYKNLYRGFMKLSFSDRVKMNDTWELYCLSGDPRAINYAIRYENLTAQTISVRNETAIHLAALSGSVSAIAITLTMKDIDPLCYSIGCKTAYHYAALSGSVNAMTKILKVKGMNPLARTWSFYNDSKTAYHFAARSGSPAAMIKALEVKGMDPLAKDKYKRTAFHYAARSGSSAAMTKALKVKGMDPLAKDKYKRTAFHFAAMSGSVAAMAKALEVDEGMDPLAKDRDGRTAYHFAARSGSPAAMIKALEVKGMDPLARDNNGMTAYHYAARSGSPAAMTKALEVKEMDPLARDRYGRTAYHYAAMSGSPAAMIKALEVKGMDPLAKDGFGRTAYHYAAKSGSVAAMAKALEVKGMDPLAKDIIDESGYDITLLGWRGSQAAVKKALEIETKALELQRSGPLAKTDSDEKTNYSAATSGSMNAVDSKHVQSKSDDTSKAKSDIKESSFSNSSICKDIIIAINVEINRFGYNNAFYTIGMTRKAARLVDALTAACNNMQSINSIDDFLNFTADKANTELKSLKQILQEPRKWPGSTPLYGKTDSWRNIEKVINTKPENQALTR